MSSNTVRLASGGTVQVRTGVLRGVGPTGATGEAGVAATVTIGTVTTGSAGSSAAVTPATGSTTNAAIWNFSIPQGVKGDTGTSVYVGSGAPTSSPPAPATSNNGDVYMDYTNKNIYVKASGAWPASPGNGNFGGGSTGPTGAGYSGVTSATSNTIGTGSKTWSLASITHAFIVGQRVRVVANVSNYVEGIITASSTTEIAVNVTNIVGSAGAAYTSWTFGLTGIYGSTGVQSYANATAVSAALYTSANTSGLITNGTIYLQQDTNTMYVYLWDGTTGTSSVLSTVNISSSTPPTSGTYPYASLWVQY